jgi:hypothetical protein
MISYKKSHPNWVPYGVFGLLCLITVLQISSIARLNNFVSKDRYAFVQTPLGGSVKQAEAVDSDYRSPQTINKFIRQWKHLTFTWPAKTPDGKPEQRTTMAGQSIPAPLAKGLMAVVAPYRQEYLLKQVAVYKQKGFPIEAFALGRMTARVENTIAISNLHQTSKGHWEVDIASTRTISEPSKPDVFEIRAEKLHLVAVPPYFETWEPKDSKYYKEAREMQDLGLMVEEIN